MDLRKKLLVLEEMLDELSDDFYTTQDEVGLKLNEAIAYLSDIITEMDKGR